MDLSSPERELLLQGLSQFVLTTQKMSFVLRIALIGSLLTNKLKPKDVDLLVTVDAGASIEQLADAGRKLKGRAQSLNLGADIFIANADGQHLGRTCSYIVCHPRRACAGRSCSEGKWICDDFEAVQLLDDLVASPPLELWPRVVVRVPIPSDVRTILRIGEIDRPAADPT